MRKSSAGAFGSSERTRENVQPRTGIFPVASCSNSSSTKVGRKPYEDPMHSAVCGGGVTGDHVLFAGPGGSCGPGNNPQMVTASRFFGQPKYHAAAGRRPA